MYSQLFPQKTAEDPFPYVYRETPRLSPEMNTFNADISSFCELKQGSYMKSDIPQ